MTCSHRDILIALCLDLNQRFCCKVALLLLVFKSSIGRMYFWLYESSSFMSIASTTAKRSRQSAMKRRRFGLGLVQPGTEFFHEVEKRKTTIVNKLAHMGGDKILNSIQSRSSLFRTSAITRITSPIELCFPPFATSISAVAITLRD